MVPPTGVLFPSTVLFAQMLYENAASLQYQAKKSTARKLYPLGTEKDAVILPEKL